MLDKVLTIVAILTLFAFVSIVVWFVPEPDLTIIIVIVLVMVVFDFYPLRFRKKNSDD